MEVSYISLMNVMFTHMRYDTQQISKSVPSKNWPSLLIVWKAGNLFTHSPCTYLQKGWAVGSTKKFIAKDKRIEELKKRFSYDTISLGEYTAI